ncbi:GxxExxY protein [Owenweeksia hongkongensis]|uniref:GxxExxY protein n=1 Tax=Owenweeksia hongkongensis TaxID=253245 RepID=UPI003A92213E
MHYIHSNLTGEIIRCAMEVHTNLGPGLLENAYEECLYYELLQTGLLVDKQFALPLDYKDVRLDCGYRIDLYVEKKVIVEVKSVSALQDIHMAQIMTYLKLTECKVGLLLNFNVKSMKTGIRRIVL